MADSLFFGHGNPRSDRSASCSSHCSLGTRWRESRILLGIGSGAYSDANDEYTAATEAVDAFLGLDTEAEDFDADAALGT